MARYKCFYCNKKIASEEIGSKRVRCRYCGSKMIYKPRYHITKIKAR